MTRKQKERLLDDLEIQDTQAYTQPPMSHPEEKMITQHTGHVPHGIIGEILKIGR